MQMSSIRRSCPALVVLAAMTFVAQTMGQGRPETAVEPAGAPAPPAAPPEPGPNTGKIHFSGGIDLTNSYFFRGIRQDRGAFILQPYGTLTADLVQTDSLQLSASGGTWNSFHDTAIGATTSDAFERKWYEADWSIGLTATMGKWTVAALYLWETSPSGAWQTIEELDLSVAFDDSELLGAWKLSPSVLLAIETGSSSLDIADSDRGVYLQTSISPGFDAELPAVGKTAFTFPVIVGLSLSDYYQDASGKDSTFGFLDLGARAAIALPVAKAYGEWTLALSLHWLVLGDHAAEFDSGKHGEVIATIGIAVSY